MPVRLRITILFTLMVFVVLGIVCSSIYYFTYKSRRDAIWVRLSNRAITTARLLSKSEIFDRQLIQRIDSLTTLALKNKSVQAYNDLDKRIYNYSDIPGDTVSLTGMMDIARRARAIARRGTRGLAGAEVLVGGFAAGSLDSQLELLRRLPITVGFILGIIAIMLFFAFRSLLVPL